MKYTAILAALFALALQGCASFDLVQGRIAGSGAKAADEMRQTAEWTLCNGISIGAWRRAYAGNSDQAAGWAALCRQADGVPQ